MEHRIQGGRLPHVGVNDPSGVGMGHVCQSKPEFTILQSQASL